MGAIVPGGVPAVGVVAAWAWRARIAVAGLQLVGCSPSSVRLISAKPSPLPNRPRLNSPDPGTDGAASSKVLLKISGPSPPKVD
jgi:hypothetical protein